MCAYMYVGTHMHGTCVLMYAHVMWRPEGMLGIFLGHFPTLFTEAEALSPTQGPPSAVVLHSASFGDPVSASQSWN